MEVNCTVLVLEQWLHAMIFIENDSIWKFENISLKF